MNTDATAENRPACLRVNLGAVHGLVELTNE